ncbi:MAG: nucleotidyltransferase family protein [Lachnospiraceae bacterium]|nr:nucleotidyltransferase family protein [Lachnospiraceae bacterium]
MKIIGIIAEYNPFHKGHAYQINELRKQTNADYIIIAMSGNFVQRGVPALCDKYTRTKMALSCGADLVLELPTLWATASAEYFAKSGVQLFENTGVVTHLGFGAESSNLEALLQISNILVQEPNEYQILLSNALKKGVSFPVARKQALFPCLSDSICELELNNLLDSPNNILGIEYLKALQTIKSKIIPILIQRKGAGYHDTSLENILPSATGIRKLLFNANIQQIQNHDTINTKNILSETKLQTQMHNVFSNNMNTEKHTQSKNQSLTIHDIVETLSTSIPEPVLPILADIISQNALLEEDDLSSILGYHLLTLQNEGYSNFADCTKEMSNKIKKHLPQYTNIHSFCELLKSKELTHTRISRTLLHILLNIYQTDYICTNITPYLRVLGFKQTSSPLLSMIKKNTNIPIVTKVADAHRILSPNAYHMFEKDLFASSIYYQLLAQKTQQKPLNEFTSKIVII